jgi:hypothetical protein
MAMLFPSPPLPVHNGPVSASLVDGEEEHVVNGIIKAAINKTDSFFIVLLLVGFCLLYKGV